MLGLLALLAVISVIVRNVSRFICIGRGRHRIYLRHLHTDVVDRLRNVELTCARYVLERNVCILRPENVELYPRVTTRQVNAPFSQYGAALPAGHERPEILIGFAECQIHGSSLVPTENVIVGILVCSVDRSEWC